MSGLQHFFERLTSGGFSAKYSAILARAAAIPTSNLPSTSNQTAQNRLIESLKRGGAGWAQAGIDLLAEIELLYVPANDASDRVFGRINWINPGTFESAEVGGAMTKVENVGIYGTTTIYATMGGYRPGIDKVKISNTDVSLAYWVTDDVPGGTGSGPGVETTAANRLRFYYGDFGVNSARSTHSNILDSGFQMINADSSIIYRWVNGILRVVGSGVYGTLSDFALPLTGHNIAGTITGRAATIGIVMLGKKMEFDVIPLYSCFDEYMNGQWPVSKTLTLDITPSPVTTFDYFGFPNIINTGGLYHLLNAEIQDHGISSEGYAMYQTSADKGLTWANRKRIIANGFIKRITLSGSSGSGIGTINGFNYTATFNSTLTQTANDFVTTHAATLLTRGITVTSPVAGVLHFVSSDESLDISMSWNNAGGVGGTIAYYQGCGDSTWGVTDTGRIIHFWYAIRGQIRIPMLKYSDDGVTFTQSQQWTTYFDSVGQAAGPGKAITLSNGDMLMSVYGTVEDRAANPSATRTIFIFKCLAADNGLVWSLLSRITGDQITLSGTSGTANINIDGTNYLATFSTNLTTTAANFVTTHGATLSGLGITVTAATGVLTFTYTGTQRILTIANASGNLYGQFTLDLEESCLVDLGSGEIGITMRSDAINVGQSYWSKSTDSGATWNKISLMSQSRGKNPVAVNTDGSVIMVLGRWAGTTNTQRWETMVSISQDGGATWRHRLMNPNHKWYMYGDLLYDNEFVTVHSEESNNDYLGPANLILNKFA